MKNFIEWYVEKNFFKDSSLSSQQELILEGISTSRYSIEVNYRTKKEEVLKAFAKICLGYVGASMKKLNYHIKQVYEKDPIRIIVSSRNWDDGEWVVVIHYYTDNDKGYFVISNGFYNKETQNVSIQNKRRCNSDSAADITKELINMMYDLKDQPDNRREKLKGVPLKRGPKR